MWVARDGEQSGIQSLGNSSNLNTRPHLRVRFEAMPSKRKDSRELPTFPMDRSNTHAIIKAVVDDETALREFRGSSTAA
jgi:hypothetical protein